jgi:hypothetical protein
MRAGCLGAGMLQRREALSGSTCAPTRARRVRRQEALAGVLGFVVQCVGEGGGGAVAVAAAGRALQCHPSPAPPRTAIWSRFPPRRSLPWHAGHLPPGQTPLLTLGKVLVLIAPPHLTLLGERR